MAHPTTALRDVLGRSRLAIAVSFLGLLLLALALFWPATHGPFVFDDFPNLQNLSQLEGSPDLAHLGQYLFAFNGNPGRPLAALSFVIEDSAWPTSPFAFKRDNLLLHLLVGVLVFALTRGIGRLLPRTRPRADLVALAVSAAWLLHPIQLSATMLVVQRMNILCSVFVLLGLLAYLKTLRTTAWPDRRRALVALAFLAVSAPLAMLCKENGVLVFAYATALNLTLLRDELGTMAPSSRRLLQWGAAAPLFVLAGVALANISAISHEYAARDFTLQQRLLTEPRALTSYIREILLPRIGAQGIFHDGFVASRDLLSPPTTLFSIMLLAAAASAAWTFRKRFPLFSFAVFWFLGGHLIESTVIPLELYFEHRNYLPMVGPLFAIVASLAMARESVRRAGWTLMIGWLILIGGETTVNARTWGSRGELAHVWLLENPRSPRAVQMVASYQADTGDLGGARRTLEEGLARMPEAEELAIQINLADCLTRGFTRPEWKRLLELASRVRYSGIVPDLVSRFGHQQRGARCMGTLQPGDFIRLAEATLSNPHMRSDVRAYLYFEMSRQAAHERNLQKTMEYLDASYANRPNPLVARNQAIYLLTAGLPDDAMRYLKLSEETPEPWIKAELLNIKSMNVSLWNSAWKMKRDMEAHKASPSGATPSTKKTDRMTIGH